MPLPLTLGVNDTSTNQCGPRCADADAALGLNGPLLLYFKTLLTFVNRRCYALFGYLTLYNIFKIDKSMPVLCSAPKVRGSTSPAALALSGMKFSCDKCSYFTNRESKMEEHMAAHGGRWICSVCNKAFVKVNKMVWFNPKQELCVTV